jgi:hypothetical protein
MDDALGRVLNRPAELSSNPVTNLLNRLKLYFTAKADAARCLDMSHSDRARLDRGVSLSRRRRQDIGLSEEYRNYDPRNEVANIAARHGMPL